MERKHKNIMCPSAPVEVGALLIGYVGKKGFVEFCQTPLLVDRHFAKQQKSKTHPKVYRYATKCIAGACNNWVEGHCCLPERLAETPNSPKNCPIRNTCRWFLQEGISACCKCSGLVFEGLIDHDGCS